MAELAEIMRRVQKIERKRRPITNFIGVLSEEEIQEHEELTKMKDILIKKFEELQFFEKQYNAHHALFWANLRAKHQFGYDLLELKGIDIFGGTYEKEDDEDN